jgi:hypothetical protein
MRDVAMYNSKTMLFFGAILTIYTTFTASPERHQILGQTLHLTSKPLSNIR